MEHLSDQPGQKFLKNRVVNFELTLLTIEKVTTTVEYQLEIDR